MANHRKTNKETQEKKIVMETINGIACPFIAIKGDPETHFEYTSKANYCHQVDPVEPIHLSYQGSVCLTEKYNSCPVYLGTWKGSLPPEIRGEITNKNRPSRSFWLGLLMAIVGFGVIWMLINPTTRVSILSAFSATQESFAYSYLTASNTPSSTSTSSPTLAGITTSVAVSNQSDNEATATPSLTPTFFIPTPGPFLQTPFGPYDSFVIHKVAAGESVTLLADNYDTSNEVIIAVNGLKADFYFFDARTPEPTSDKPYLSPTPTLDEAAAPTLQPTATIRAIPTATKASEKPTITTTPTPYETPEIWTTVLIRPGDILVILPGQKDPEQVGQYRAVYISEVGKVDDIARLYGMTTEELRYYNSLGPGELIAAERWLVIPHEEAGPPPTPAPTLAATIDFSFAITSRFGPSEEYILHMIRPGENITMIASRYQTTVDVMWAANGLSALQPGDVLVVLPGWDDPSGIPMFVTLLVDTDISTEELAAQMRVFESDLLWFNGLEDDEIVPAGRWVIYPKPDEEEK